MNLKTKLKAISACAKAAQEVADAINRGSFDDLEVIFKKLVVELKVIQVTEKVFPDGGFHSDSATEFKFYDEEYILKIEELLKRYRNRESPEQHKDRQIKLTAPLTGVQMVEMMEKIAAEQIQEEE